MTPKDIKIGTDKQLVYARDMLERKSQLGSKPQKFVKDDTERWLKAFKQDVAKTDITDEQKELAYSLIDLLPQLSIFWFNPRHGARAAVEAIVAKTTKELSLRDGSLFIYRALRAQIDQPQ